MSNISYHCPNCGSGLKFDATKGNFSCEYCDSEFDRYDLENQTGEVERPAETEEYSDSEEVAEYYCNSCGAHIITAPTTVATECYYCHNTVIMKKSIANNDMPTRIVPFKIDKEMAKTKFKQWIFKKTYIPKEFRDDQYIQYMEGIYFPYWLVDVDGEFAYKGNMYHDTYSSKAGKRTKYREKYKIEKEGQIHMEDIMMSALKRSQRKLIEGVQPFEEEGMEPFTMTYLSGFQAEQKDIEIEEINNQESMNIFGRYANKAIQDTLEKNCFHDTKKFTFKPSKIKWEYSLMPVWVITYKYKEEMYYFAMNGQTGKTCGRIPIDKSKLIRHTMIAGAACFVFLFIIMFVMMLSTGGGLL
ncbi:MAG: hypothetical protein R3Y24_04575 [Eubacteriales bacterium]